MSTQPQLDFMEPLGIKAARPEVCAKTGVQRKRQGMERSAAKHADELMVARTVARRLGRNIEDFPNGVSIEHVRYEYEGMYGKWDLGNAAGSVFERGMWEFAGYTKATRPEAHARTLAVWRLKR